MKVLFCDTSFEHAREVLKKYLQGDEILYCRSDEIGKYIADVDVAIPLMARLHSDTIKKATKLKLIQQFGVGLEGVDIGAAQKREILVANVPSDETGNSISVAEWTVFLMLALSRDYPSQVESIKEKKLGTPLGKTLYGKRAGIIGMGRLGCAIGRLLIGMGMEVWGIKRNPERRDTVPVEIRFLGGSGRIDYLLQRVDYLILAVPLTRETKGLIGKKELEMMKPSAFLINVARGPVIDYKALLWALEEKQISGVGLDVFWEEPIDPGNPIFKYNVIASPHIAAVTDYSVEKIALAVAENIKRLKKGVSLKYLVSC